jgi:hypothetical protein
MVRDNRRYYQIGNSFFGAGVEPLAHPRSF